jgi:hypothetical protein
VGSILWEEEAELATELLALDSNEPYSSFILFNSIPFDNPSILLLRISTCIVFSIQLH